MILFATVMAMSMAITLHVSNNGSDTNPGTASEPLKTFDGARRAVRESSGRPVVVEFAAGTYRLTKPVVFDEEDSGDVTYRAAKGAAVVISGSTAFKPDWTAYRGPILKCSVPAGFETDQLFIDGQRQVLARYPNEDLSIRTLHGYAKDAISPERVAKWHDPTGGFLHAMHEAMWGDFHYRILGKNAKNELAMEGAGRTIARVRCIRNTVLWRGSSRNSMPPASGTSISHPERSTTIQNRTLT